MNWWNKMTEEEKVTIKLTRLELSRIIISLHNCATDLLGQLLDAYYDVHGIMYNELLSTIQLHQQMIKTEREQGWDEDV